MVDFVAHRRRRSLRRAYRTRCQAVRTAGFSMVGDYILDLSHRGALIACSPSVVPGNEIVLSFPAPGTGAIVDAVGEVQRIIRGRRDGDRGYCAGLRFTEIEAEIQDELFVQLIGTPPPVPQRRVARDYAATVGHIAVGAPASIRG